jgi:succinylglutamate desuccinylase
MTNEAAAGGTAQDAIRRTLGRIRGKGAGPTLLVVAAMHGNEPAGIAASRRVLERLASLRHLLVGEFVCLVGNVDASRKGVRYQAKDLNRAWTDERMDALTLARLPTPWDAEDAEQVELFQEIERTRRTARGPMTLVDVHTTSGGGAPFSSVPDTDAARTLASCLGVTSVTGLAEKLRGTMLVATSRLGMTSIVVECGQNEDPASVLVAEAAIWIALVATRLLDRADVPDLDAYERLLVAARGELPETMQIVYRHAIAPRDGFQMARGFRHFQHVSKGQILGHDVRGDVAAPQEGYILMPLYQGLGDDGFFLAR